MTDVEMNGDAQSNEISQKRLRDGGDEDESTSKRPCLVYPATVIRDVALSNRGGLYFNTKVVVDIDPTIVRFEIKTIPKKDGTSFSITEMKMDTQDASNPLVSHPLLDTLRALTLYAPTKLEDSGPLFKQNPGYWDAIHDDGWGHEFPGIGAGSWAVVQSIVRSGRCKTSRNLDYSNQKHLAIVLNADGVEDHKTSMSTLTSSVQRGYVMYQGREFKIMSVTAGLVGLDAYISKSGEAGANYPLKLGEFKIQRAATK